MTAHILAAARMRVGLYTSPHVTTLRERIRVLLPSAAAATTTACGAELPGAVTVAEWDALVAKHAAAISAQQEAEGGALTHFEVVTALALRRFADAAVDAAVVEVGLGGARDATNVFVPDQLRCAVVTTMDREHLSALGGNLAAAAAAKAGIMRRGRPALIAAQPEAEAEEALLRSAREAGAAVLRPGVRCALRAIDAPRGAAAAAEATLEEEGSGWRMAGVRLALVGPHQAGNAALAASVARLLQQQERGIGTGGGITDAAIASGLGAAWLPARFEVVWGRLRGGGGTATGGPWVFDGAHTPAAAAALCATLRAAFPRAPLALVLAMAADKDAAAFAARLAPARPAAVIATQADVAGSRARSAPPAALAAAWPEAAAARVVTPLAEALSAARRSVGPAGVVCVAGSLHAAAAARVLVEPQA